MGTAVTFQMACRANILGTEMPLEKELATYARMKADLLTRYEGKFVLIHAEDFYGAYDTAENAYAEGVKRFGQEPFLIKKVTVQEEVYRNQALSLGLINARI
jgi:hypothetical protein